MELSLKYLYYTTFGVNLHQNFGILKEYGYYLFLYGISLPYPWECFKSMRYTDHFQIFYTLAALLNMILHICVILLLWITNAIAQADDIYNMSPFKRSLFQHVVH